MSKVFNVKVLLVLSMVLCLLTGLIFFSAYDAKENAERRLTVTYNIIRHAVALYGSLENAETSQRGFILTMDSVYLADYRDATLAVSNHYALLKSAANLSSESIEHQSILHLISTRLSVMEKTLLLFRQEGKGAAERAIRDGEGKKLMDQLEAALKKITSEREVVLATSSQELIGINAFTEWLLYGSLLLIAFTLILSILTIREKELKNRQLIRSLESINETLENQVDEKTRALSRKNQELEDANRLMSASNQELLASDQEIRANLEHISQLQRHVEASEKKFRLLSENSRDIIAIFSLDNKFEYVSPACETLLGFEPHELIGRDGAELVHPDDVEKLVKPSTKANAGDDNQNPHFRLRRKDGRYIWIEAISNPIHDKDGRITAIQTSSRDITLRKEMEIALKEEKTRAEQATAAKSAFLSMMSHEIRTPMNAIIGLTNILLREPHLPEQAESLGLLKFSGENLLTIINDILDFSKIEAGKITFENVAFDLHEMLANTCAVMSSRARDKSIRLSVNLGEDLPRFVWSDQVRLNQIITNLIGNGIKFTEQGFVELSVTFGGLDEHGKSRINFQVRDTGIGIDADKLATIFESFSQASSDTTRRFGGTGLGLSITKQLLNLMGSDIRVSSQVGRGTCFDFTLHLLAAEASDGQETGRKNGKDISRRAGSVLLVEDNPINQVVAVKFLTKWGLDVKVANDGSEAVDIAREKKFHAILMDLQMPRMDGYEAARKIRALDDPYYKTVPIIALTASAMSDIKEAAALSGMNGFVSKPFQPDELYGVLSTYIPENTNGMHESRVTVNCLDLYSEADPDLRRELAGLIIKNIHELNATLNDSLQPGDDHPFVSAAHKVKTVISMVGITEYTILVEEIIEHLKEISPATGLGEKLNRFKHLSNIICHGLQEELGSV